MKNNRGFTLIETMVSLILLSIIVLGFFNTYFSVHKLNEQASQRRLAFQFCQEILIEIDQNKIPIKNGKINYDRLRLQNLNIDNFKQYKYIDQLTIISNPLIIDKKTVKDIFVIKLIAKWNNHSMNLTTIAKGGETN